MASNFSGVTPRWVHPEVPQFHNIITQSESQKKNYANLTGSTPVYRYKLSWERMTDSDYGYILAHWTETKGGFDSFIWHCVPDYIDSNHDGAADGLDMTGRWVKDSFEASPVSHAWKVDITFEEEIT